MAPFRSRGGSVAEFEDEGEPCWGVPVLQDHSRHPRAPRRETARLLFRASGPPCFQVNGSWIRSLVDPQGNAASSRGVCCGVPMHPPIRRLLRIKLRSFFRVVFAPLESSPFFGVSVQILKYLMVCSPISSPTSRGFCTMKRRRFNDLGEMKACLQSRCSPS